MKNTVVRGYIVSNNLHYIVLDRVCSLGLGVQQLIFLLCIFRQCRVDERLSPCVLSLLRSTRTLRSQTVLALPHGNLRAFLILSRSNPSLVLVASSTTSIFAAALCSIASVACV